MGFYPITKIGFNKKRQICVIIVNKWQNKGWDFFLHKQVLIKSEGYCSIYIENFSI